MKMKLSPAAALLVLALSLTACTGESGNHDFDTLPGDFEITEAETSTGSAAEDTETEPVTGTTADVTDAQTTAEETEQVIETTAEVTEAQTTAEPQPESETTAETQMTELPEKVGSVFPSPDGNYSIVCLPEDYDPSMHLDPFMLSPCKLALVDSGGNVLASSSSSGFNDDNGFKVFWSADSRFAAAEQSYRNYINNVYFSDAEKREFVKLPQEKELEELIGKPLSYVSPDGTALDYLWSFFDSWNGDVLRVKVWLGMNAGYCIDIGWYDYDAAERKIVDHDLFIPTNDEAVKEKVEALLDGMDTDKYESDRACVDAHPDEYAGLLALGNEAVPYLEQIGSDSQKYGEIKAGVAKLAYSEIAPGAFASAVCSPDWKLEIKAHISSFSLSTTGSAVYDRFDIIDRESGEVIMSVDRALEDVSRYWSPDGRFIVIIGSGSSDASAFFIDLDKKKATDTFTTSEMAEAVREELGEVNIWRTFISFSEWLEDGKVGLEFESIPEKGAADGFIVRKIFVCDPQSGEIVSAEPAVKSQW